MKKILYPVLFLSLVVVSCTKSPDPPFAEFSYEVTGDPEVGKEIRFINESENAVSFEWSFGDGYSSTEREPIYTYNSTGTFEVTLTAKGEEGDKDEASLTIDILIPTLLVVEVRDIDDERFVITNASVLLYESLTDWESADPSKSIYEGFTNDNGITVFTNLDPYVYYADVLGGNYNNWMLGLDFIRTPEVMPHEINWFVAWVEYNPGTKGLARGVKRVVPEKITRKTPAAISPKYQGTDGWKELYEMRSKR